MSESKVSAIVLLVLGIFVVLSAAGKVLIEWEWWTFLLVLFCMAFGVALISFMARRILR